MTDEEINAINRQCARQSLRLLYETHIEHAEPAELRGAAVRAVNAFCIAVGAGDCVAEMERIPYSQRRRESKIWNPE
jgi:hypothetical protein